MGWRAQQPKGLSLGEGPKEVLIRFMRIASVWRVRREMGRRGKYEVGEIGSLLNAVYKIQLLGRSETLAFM